jgi:hypothetical protein
MLMGTLPIHRTCHVAVVARDDEIRVSVARFPQPTVDGVPNLTDLTSMLRAIIFDVVQTEKLDVPLATTSATNVAAAVMRERRQTILTKPRFAVFRVADSAPGVHALAPL